MNPALRSSRPRRSTQNCDVAESRSVTRMFLIAASALVYGLAVVTNNEGHFSRVHGLLVENWLRSQPE